MALSYDHSWMPIFWLMSVVIGGGRARISWPLHIRSIEIAASWPWATAVMMFLGPNAASPPKNTFGWLEAKVTGSTFGMPSRQNSSQVVLDPRERVLLADRDQDFVTGENHVGFAGRN